VCYCSVESKRLQFIEDVIYAAQNSSIHWVTEDYVHRKMCNNFLFLNHYMILPSRELFVGMFVV
jgi:hypothetical protein